MIPAFIIARLRSLLVPELADLRQQLDQARRLASEAQGRFREAEKCVDIWRGRCHEFEIQLGQLRTELARAKDDLDERHGPLLGPIVMERDQLKARCDRDDAGITIHECPPSGAGLMPCCQRTPFEVMGDRMSTRPELVNCDRVRLMTERDQLRARVAELEAYEAYCRRNKVIP